MSLPQIPHHSCFLSWVGVIYLLREIPLLVRTSTSPTPPLRSLAPTTNWSRGWFGTLLERARVLGSVLRWFDLVLSHRSVLLWLMSLLRYPMWMLSWMPIWCSLISCWLLFVIEQRTHLQISMFHIVSTWYSWSYWPCWRTRSTSHYLLLCNDRPLNYLMQGARH